MHQIGSFVQDCANSTGNARELRQFYTEPYLIIRMYTCHISMYLFPTCHNDAHRLSSIEYLATAQHFLLAGSVFGLKTVVSSSGYVFVSQESSHPGDFLHLV